MNHISFDKRIRLMAMAFVAVLAAQIIKVPSTSLAAEDLSFSLRTENGSYTTVLYDNKNGLPTSEANAIAETEDGFIWIGSS